jgi:hypothetical protein
MASDPRFDPYGNEGAQPKPPRSKWTTCLIGCLVMSGLALVICIAIGVLVANKWRGFAADISDRVIRETVEESDLPPQEKAEVIAEVDRVNDGFRDGQVSVEQVGMIVQNVMESPLMPSIVASAIAIRYFDQSGLNAEEKAQGKITLQRFARGMIDEKIPQQGIDAVMTHVATRQADGEWRLRPKVSDADLKAALAEAKAQADTAGIPEQPEEVDPSDEIKKIIDEAMQAKE